MLRLKKILPITAAIFLLIMIVGNASLLVHNQAQTRYMVFFDFWRLSQILAGASSFGGYIIHNVHLYITCTLSWYADVLFSHGTLYVFHAIVVVVLLLGIAGLKGVINQIVPTTLHRWFLFAMMVAFLLSPSMAYWVTYPSADIIMTVVFTALVLSAFILVRLQQSRAALFAYCLLTIAAFCVLETYIIVPCTLALCCVLQRQWREAKWHIFLSLFLFISYLLLIYFFIDKTGAQSFHAENSRSIVIFLHNFFVLLSSHQLLLLQWLHISPGSASKIAIALSLVQFSFVVVWFITTLLAGKRNFCSSSLAGILFTCQGMGIIALATWLRSSTTLMFTPVPRYAPYTTLFAIGVLLLAAYTLANHKAAIIRFLALLQFSAAGLLLLIECTAFFMGYNPATRINHSRVEMAIFATNPQDAKGLGPAEPDGGMLIRTNLYDFMKERKLAIFNHPGFALLQQPAPAVENSNARCRIRQITPLDRKGYVRGEFEIDGLNTNGVFLTVDKSGVVSNFGLSASPHPLSHFAETVLKADALESADKIIYATVNDKTDTIKQSIFCQAKQNPIQQ